MANSLIFAVTGIMCNAMRLTKIIIVFFMFLGVLAPAQSGAYKAGMKKSLLQFHSADNKAEFLKAAHSFETLALSEKGEWLPYYYAGLCQAIGAFSAPKTEIDALCDKGDQLARVADSLSPKNSEVEVLKSMISAARIGVDQKKRGQKYGVQASKQANAAIKFDGTNPRAYLLKGRALLHTPEAFGGGDKKAKAVFETALEKFKTFKPGMEFSPVWGKEEVEKELKAIQDKASKS